MCSRVNMLVDKHAHKHILTYKNIHTITIPPYTNYINTFTKHTYKHTHADGTVLG